MPKKKHYNKSFKPLSTSTQASSSTHNKAPRSVNELIANSRHAHAWTGQSASPRGLPATTPSVPPAIREILQLPETPAPLPRRPVRQRFDQHGRRLPAGPPPPRSWTAALAASRADGVPSRSSRLSRISRGGDSLRGGLDDATLPGTYLPSAGSLIDLVLRRLAIDWQFHRIYNQYHLYFLPGHLKPALIRWISLVNEDGVSIADLRAILLPPPDVYQDDEVGHDATSNAGVTSLDLSGSVARSIRLKDISDLLFPTQMANSSHTVADSWDGTDTRPTILPVLLPNLTHLSLELDHQSAGEASWKQLLAIAPKLKNVTHLSLAYWPAPCFTPGARYASVTSPQGRSIPYAGTNYYSHSIDHDWSEALLVLRILSKSLYELEFLDLTGCSPWFAALTKSSEHDFVDWAGDWGKLTLLRLYNGWRIDEDALPSQIEAHRESIEMARQVEKHIIAMRAGTGRFITVERDRTDS